METTQTVAPLLHINFNHEADSTPESLGLNKERATEIENEVKGITETFNTTSECMEGILQKYTIGNELVWALFILTSEEEEVVNSLGNEDSQENMPVFEE